MSSNEYTPPKVWSWTEGHGGRFANINRPTAGARETRELPVGRHPFQLYSMGTPNGQKVTILLEELLASGVTDAEYDAWLISILEGEQFGSGFVEVNPNSKIPGMVDQSGEKPFRVFESGAILLHLAMKFDAFIPAAAADRAECLSWLMWQMGSAPFLGGGFGHFYAYAPEKIEYAIDRYAMETKRQMDVLDQHLANRAFLAGEYSIADMAVWPWYGALSLGRSYPDAETFLSVDEYENVRRWAQAIDAREAVKRGTIVNRSGEDGIEERHEAGDIDAFLADRPAS